VNERAFRLDFVIAIGALLVSALTAATLVYQTHVIGEQFSAAIWPYLSIGTTYSANGETIVVTNDGLGPALVRSARLTVDGTAVRAWNDYVSTLEADPRLSPIFQKTRAAVLAGRGGGATLSMSSIGPSSTLRPGATSNLLKLTLAGDVPSVLLNRHPISIDLCYCSLNGSCWSRHSTPGRISADPKSVAQCTASTAIESRPLTPTRSKTGAAAR
jgi:hypothetical protein